MMMQITTARRKAVNLIKKMQMVVGPEMTVSIVLSRATREARRMYGLEGAEQLFQRLAEAMPDGDHAEAVVPAFELGRRERMVWVTAGMMIDTLCASFPSDTAFQIVLS